MDDFNPSDIAECKALVTEECVTLLYEDDARRPGWALVWRHGTMSLGGQKDDENGATTMAAIFVYLWNRKVHASLAMELAVAYVKVRK